MTQSPTQQARQLDDASESRRPASFIRAFNWACYALALVWLMVYVPHNLRVHPVGREHDFSQFYMGGVIARYAAWDALYPIPKPHSIDNPGEVKDSDMRPRYAQLAQEKDVGDHQRYIQPPPFALLLAPLGYLPYEKAQHLWNRVMIFCAWLLGLQAARIYARLNGRASIVSGILCLGVAVSPLALSSLRLINVSPLVGVLGGAVVMELIARQPKPKASALVMIVGVVCKYTNLIFVPLYVALRRWRALMWMAILAVVVLGVSLAVMGAGPFATFARQIAPTLGRPHTMAWNRSLCGTVMLAMDQVPLHTGTARVIHLAGLAVLAGLLLLIFARLRPSVASALDPHPRIVAAAAALLAWFLIFGPIVWDHYFLYVVPFWGWLLWEARRSLLAALGTAYVIAWQWLVSDTLLDKLHLSSALKPDLPYDWCALATLVIVLLIAVVRLAGAPRENTRVVTAPAHG